MATIDSPAPAPAPAQPPPDDADWTWVLGAPCPQCGFVAAEFDATGVGDAIRANALAWVGILGAAGPELAARPHPEQWSALEYAAHVRDVFDLYLVRLDLMLTQGGPQYANWDQNVTAVEKRYDLAVPAEVSAELFVAANALADRFDTVEGDQWQRTGFRSDGAAFTVDSFARYLIHDPIHHLWDVEQGFAQLP